MNRLLIILSTFFYFHFSYSQQSDYQNEYWIDYLIETNSIEDNEEDINQLIELLQERAERPFNLNTVGKEELETLPFLTPLQIENLLYHRYVFGDFKTEHELLSIEEFDRETVDLIKPFFYVGEGISRPVEKLLKRNRQEVLIRSDRNLNRKYGYVDKPDSMLMMNPNKQYRGSPWYQSVKYRYNDRKNLQFGFSLEKDPGERFRKEFPFYDFSTFYVTFKNKGVVRNVTAGSYKLSLGCGLVINNGFSIGKSIGIQNLFAMNESIKPHTSTDDYNYMQGKAAQIKFARWL